MVHRWLISVRFFLSFPFNSLIYRQCNFKRIVSYYVIAFVRLRGFFNRFIKDQNPRETTILFIYSGKLDGFLF